MPEMTIFKYFEYRDYLENRLKSKDYGRGGKAKFAQHLSCQPSFISQVLKGKCSFSLEQTYKITSFLKLNQLETEYLFTLVEYDRAGTHELKSYLEEKLKKLIQKSKRIENHMSYDQLSDEDTMSYYNKWNHILIRNLIDIPKYKTEKALKKKLDIDDNELQQALDFLNRTGLIQKDKDGLLQQGHRRLHIKKDSPLEKFGNITSHMQMIKNYEKKKPDDISYICNMTLPRRSFDEFKAKLTSLIVDLNKRIDSDVEPEMMAVLMLDLMEI